MTAGAASSRTHPAAHPPRENGLPSPPACLAAAASGQPVRDLPGSRKPGKIVQA